MKEGWELHTLGDVATFINGDRSTNYPSKKDYVVDGIPFVNAGNLIQTGLDIASLNFISQDKYDSLTQGRFVEGDILFCLRGTLGKHSIVQNGLKGAVASSLVIIRTKDGFCNKYISYYLDYKQPFIERLNNGAAQPNIPAKTMKGFSIQFPPNQKQQQSIVEYLDSAFAKIDAMKANAEKALNEAKALFQASLKEMLEPKEGWEENKLKEICETITDFVAAGSFASLRENVVYNNEKDYAQLVRTTDLKSGFSKGGYVYVNEHAFKYLYRVNLDKECIILPNVGVNCGEVYYVTPSILPYNNNVLGPNAVLVRSSNYNNHFLSYLFLGKDFQNKLSDITSHMAQPKFNKTGLKEIVILVPPLSEQQSIVTTLDSLKSKVDQLQENYDKISQECDVLKQAMLRQVFE